DHLQVLFTFQTAHLVPAARFCARVCFFRFAHPDEGWRSAESRRVLARHPWPALGGRQAPWRRRLASHTGEARLPALAPWRFWAAGPRFLSPAFAPDRSQRTPRIRVVVPGGGAPASRGDGSRAAAAGRHASLRLQDASGRRPSKSKAEGSYYTSRNEVNIKIRYVATKFLHPGRRKPAGRLWRKPQVLRPYPPGFFAGQLPGNEQRACRFFPCHTGSSGPVLRLRR